MGENDTRRAESVENKTCRLPKANKEGEAMGEKDTSPINLYIKSSEGEYIPVPYHIPEINLSEKEAESEELPFMSCGRQCRFCTHIDLVRKKDGKVRCKRWSQWVKPIGEVCEEYTEGFTFTIPQKGAEEHE